jgi:methionyl-tRNA formyltransferase
VTYADKVDKRELALDPADGVLANLRRVLASTPQAPARCVIDGKPVTVLAARPPCPAPTAPIHSRPVTFVDRRLLLATADGDLEVVSLKPDGRKEMSAAAFAAGVRGLQKGGREQAVVVWHAPSVS